MSALSRAGCRPASFREQQALLFAASPERAPARAGAYAEGGATSYLEVRDADTRLFDAELGLAQAELS